MSRRTRWCALWTGVLLSVAGISPAQQILYGGNEWLQFFSANTGWLVTVDQETGAVTLIGRPAGVDRISGLAFDAAGTLWATSLTGTESGTIRTSTLLKLNPSDGSLLETIGPVLDGPGGPPIAIESLGFQPATGALFGSRGIADLEGHGGDVHRIDPETGVATLLTNSKGAYKLAMLAFAPDGTLYQAVGTYPLNPGGNPRLQTLDPVTGAVLTSLPTPRFYKALAVRNDGVLFGASPVNNMTSEIDDFFRIDRGTGDATFLGQTGNNPIGSLAFGPEASPCLAEDPRCFEPRIRVLRPGEERAAPRIVVRPDP